MKNAARDEFTRSVCVRLGIELHESGRAERIMVSISAAGGDLNCVAERSARRRSVHQASGAFICSQKAAGARSRTRPRAHMQTRAVRPLAPDSVQTH